jgi:hypothetical protein
VFDLTEEAFDQIAIFVNRCIKAAPCGSGGPARHDGFCASGGDGIHGALAIITFVGQNMTCLQSFKQRFDLGDIVAFTTGQDEPNRITQRIGGSMNLGAQATF